MNRARHTPGGGAQPGSGPAAVAAHIPHGLFIMTAAYEDASAGTLVRWVQRCSDDPAVVMVSLRRGQPIEPLIRDSRAFALCQISEDDRFLQRRFSPDCAAVDADEGLISISARCAPSGSPILEHAMSCMDCELLRNVDLDNEYRLYIGQVHHAELLTPARPAMFFGECNGRH
jgi:flavin reductase (DIM6/NTAB) family NADH-FMN oxidoreductase RutF